MWQWPHLCRELSVDVGTLVREYCDLSGEVVALTVTADGPDAILSAWLGVVCVVALLTGEVFNTADWCLGGDLISVVSTLVIT